MPKYAEKTSVSLDQSLAEIRRTITRYGASKFGYIQEEDAVTIAFEMRDRRIRFVLPLPNPNSKEFTHTPSRGLQREPEQALAAYEQAVKQKFRALALAVKAKLESVDAGIETFEEAFLAHIVMPDGVTVSEHVLPRIAQAYESGQVPQLLPGK